MGFGLVLKGLVSGLIVGAPFGPVGLLCMRNALRKGRIHGLLGGLGIASANAVYTLVIGYSLAIVSKLLTEYMVIFRILGGAVVCFIGISLMRSASPGRRTGNKISDVTSSYLSMFFIAISNIPAILLFIAVFSFLGVTSSNLGYTSGLELALGVFLGTLTWWLALVSKMDLIKIKINRNSKTALYIQRVLGFGIIALGFGNVVQSIASIVFPK
ncbi:MAG TPA: LysE family transporter [Clostridiaceae bacterium]|nr:LysE family transporter [Clostridiaceae bacterium]